MAEGGAGDAFAVDQTEQRGGCQQRAHHRDGGAMRRRSDGAQHDQADPLGAGERIAAHQQEIQRQHAQAAEDVGEQDRGQERQRGEDRQRGHAAEQQPGPAAEAMHAQQQRENPHRQRRLCQQHRPERQRHAGIEHEAIDDGAARHQCAFVPARQIAAGVVLQQRKPVPDRRRDQDRDRQYNRKRPKGAVAPRHSNPPRPHRFLLCLDTVLTVCWLWRNLSVIAGLDPAIPIRDAINLLSGMAGA